MRAARTGLSLSLTKLSHNARQGAGLELGHTAFPVRYSVARFAPREFVLGHGFEDRGKRAEVGELRGVEPRFVGAWLIHFGGA